MDDRSETRTEESSEFEESGSNSVSVCDCQRCPDLSVESSICCKSIKKAQSICLEQHIPCICSSKKLEKLLDKARQNGKFLLISINMCIYCCFRMSWRLCFSHILIAFELVTLTHLRISKYMLLIMI